VVTGKPRDDRALEFLSVRYSKVGDEGNESRTAGPGNTTTIGDLAPGTYRVEVESDGLKGSAEVVVSSGERKPVTIDLE
jgi:hypothetical protein